MKQGDILIFCLESTMLALKVKLGSACASFLLSLIQPSFCLGVQLVSLSLFLYLFWCRFQVCTKVVVNVLSLSVHSSFLGFPLVPLWLPCAFSSQQLVLYGHNCEIATMIRIIIGTTMNDMVMPIRLFNSLRFKSLIHILQLTQQTVCIRLGK